MNREMSLSKRVMRAADSCELEKVLASHNYLHAASRSYEEWTTVWSRRDDTSWAHSFGRMRGFASIWMGSVVDYDMQCIENYRAVEKNYPEVAGMDFVKEEDGWKFLHYQVCPEFFDLFDVFNPAAMMYHNLKNDIPAPPNPTPAYLDDPGPLHMECGPLQPVQDTCPPPLPYETMSNRNSYTKFVCYGG